VKGGVGKSTLSYLVARRIAEELGAGERVALVDADLTGTSLADVLPLRAPWWGGLASDAPLPLDRAPDGWHPPDPARGDLAMRATYPDGHARVVPLLNDFLLWSKNRYDADADVHPEALFWKPPEDDPLAERLVVLPSSALPNDLGHILPLIYDELHAAYLESRLEWLLHWMIDKADVSAVVFDTPPTIPGLSRAVLSLAMRLPEYEELAEDGGTPLWLTRERGAAISWTPFLVASPDLQDLRAAERWLEGRRDDERARIQVVINGTDRDGPDETERLRDKLGAPSGGASGLGSPRLYGGDLLREPMVVREQEALRIFGGEPRASATAEGLESIVARFLARAPGSG
jgi:hypothetical protein